MRSLIWSSATTELSTGRCVAEWKYVAKGRDKNSCQSAEAALNFPSSRAVMFSMSTETTVNFLLRRNGMTRLLVQHLNHIGK